MSNPRNNGAMDAKSGTREGSTAKSNMKTRVAIIVAIVVIAALVVVIIMLLRKEEAPAQRETINNGRGTVATSDNAQDIAEQLTEPVQDGYYLTTMNVEWKFATWDTPSSNAYVENAPANTRTVYFDVLLDDGNTLVYSSPFIPVGARHEKFALTSELAAGDHPATVVYHLVDEDDNEITTLSVGILLKVLG